MKLINLQNKTCLLTGASRGIGKAIATYLHNQGVILCVVASKKESFVALKSDIGDKGVYYIAGDLLDETFAMSLPEQAYKLMGSLDYVINNAGVAFAKSFVDSTLSDYNAIMNLNVKVPFMICQQAIKYLKHSEVATIINMSSVVGQKGYENQSLYSASKHALEGLTKAFAKEIQKDNIRVHLLEPGGVKTEMVIKTRPDLDVSVLIEPEEIADLVGYLLSRRNNGVIESIHMRRDANQPFK